MKENAFSPTFFVNVSVVVLFIFSQIKDCSFNFLLWTFWLSTVQLIKLSILSYLLVDLSFEFFILAVETNSQHGSIHNKNKDAKEQNVNHDSSNVSNICFFEIAIVSSPFMIRISSLSS